MGGLEDAANGVRSSLQSLTKTKLDLVGLISALGTESAKKSLSFSAMNDVFSVTGHIGPGSLWIATSLIQMAGFRVADLLTLGNSGAPLQMDCPQDLRCVGLHSGSKYKVANTVGAAVVREHKLLWEKQSVLADWQESTAKQNLNRDAGRKVEVLVLSAELQPQIKAQLQSGKLKAKLKATQLHRYVLGWLPLLLTIGVMSMAFLSQEWFAGALIGLGTLGMFLAVLALHFSLFFKYDHPKVCEGAPPGDCLIVDESNGNILHIFKGNEDVIQTLFQRTVQQHDGFLGRVTVLLAGCMLYIYSIASVLWLPNVSIYGQLFFTAANLIGLVTDMMKGSKNGKLGLARKARWQFRIKLDERVVFGNRTSAIAFVARYVENCSSLQSEHLLPQIGPVWKKWWEVLSKAHLNVHDNLSVHDEVTAFGQQHPSDDCKLFANLISDMRYGLTYQAPIAPIVIDVV